MSDFKFGVYEHYNGGRYTAFMLVRHHDTGQLMVVYVSHEKGTVNARPLRGWTNHDPDGFLDELRLPGREHEVVPRFRYLGP